MAVAEVASVRTVAVQLRSLSADEENQPIIAREDGCLRALISFIVGEDADVAAIAVAALKNLSSHPDNYELMRGEEELIEGLKDLLFDEETTKDVRREIFDILEELTDEDNDAEMDELDELEKKAGLLPENEDPSLDDDPSLLPSPIMTRLHVPNLSDDMVCTRVEQLLVRKRGVISVVFEIGAEDAVIFARIASDELATFLKTMTGAEIEVLPYVDEDAEEEEDENNPEDAGAEKENASQPGYLDEKGERFKDMAKKGAKKKNTISQGASSLAARLEAQREEESRKKARANRLLDSIGRGFTSNWGWS